MNLRAPGEEGGADFRRGWDKLIMNVGVRLFEWVGWGKLGVRREDVNCLVLMSALG